MAARLIMTEQAFFASAATKDSYLEFGVKEFEIIATLDSHTSEICRDLDGRHFPMKDYEPGVTAAPFHVYCRSTTCPYFDAEFTEGEMRAARGEDGKTYYVPADMKYEDWKRTIAKDQGEIAILGLGASSGKSGGRKEELGRIDPEDTDELVEYYNEIIRNEDIEHCIIVESDGRVLHFEGDSQAVGLNGVNFDGTTITHNHPASNGIVSFGEDDFYVLRQNPGIKELIAVNKKYTYSVKVLKDMDDVIYTDVQRGALMFIDDDDFEIQHAGFLYLDKEGYVRYVRKKLSSDQLQRIEKIKGEWLEEIGKVSKPAKYTWPDCSMGKEYRDLEKKYWPRIKAIMEE